MLWPLWRSSPAALMMNKIQRERVMRRESGKRFRKMEEEVGEEVEEDMDRVGEERWRCLR